MKQSNRRRKHAFTCESLGWILAIKDEIRKVAQGHSAQSYRTPHIFICKLKTTPLGNDPITQWVNNDYSNDIHLVNIL